MDKAVKYENKFYEQVPELLTQFLNEVHGENHSTIWITISNSYCYFAVFEQFEQ